MKRQFCAIAITVCYLSLPAGVLAAEDEPDASATTGSGSVLVNGQPAKRAGDIPGAITSPPSVHTPPVRTAALDGDSIVADIADLKNEASRDLSSFSLKKIKKKALDRIEREVISYVLQKTDWNRSKASKILKVSYKTLLQKIRECGIRDEA